MRRIWYVVCLVFFGLSVWWVDLSAAPNYPTVTGFVVDQAQIIDTNTEARITARLETLEATSTSEIAVATVSSLEGYTIEEYSTGLFSYWGIGKAKQDNGVLLLIAPNEREVRIEVGYGLEGALTDLESSQIIDSILIPAFRAEKYSAGIEEAVNALIQAVEGEYSASSSTYSDESNVVGWIMGIIIVLVLLFFAWAIFSAALMEFSRSKSVLGGSILGALIGSFVGGLTGSWIYAGIFGAIIGGLVDWAISHLSIFKRFRQKAEEEAKNRPTGPRKGGFGGSSTKWGGGSSGKSSGGFGGFGGGRSGGGGASGRW